MTVPSSARLPTAAPVTAQLTFTLGNQIGAGQGKNSEVFLAQDHQIDAQIVVKRLEKSTFPLPTEYFAEARRLYDARHRHVVELKFAAETTDHIYFAMPFYRGGSLQSVLEARYLTVREIVRFGLEFLSGLHHVHVKGLVHFDVKPTNILIDHTNTAALADFGLSRELLPTGLAPLPTFYKFHVPPERLQPGVSDVARTADIYQAGVTLYRMCVGEVEYQRQLGTLPDPTRLSSAIQTGTLPDRSRRLPHIPVQLHNTVKKCLVVDPTLRFQDALTVMNALAQVDASLDWSYREGATWGEGTWTESDGIRGRRVSLESLGGAWNVHSCRVSGTRRETRYNAFCGVGMTQSTARRLVERSLTEAWG